MKKTILVLLLVAMAMNISLAQRPTSKDVKDLAVAVALKYYESHTTAVDSWWSNSVYHIGNIELYKVTRDPRLLQYTLKWARHNQFMGATEPDPRRWRFREPLPFHVFVLAGEWQVCFQVYADLANITGDSFMCRRAFEVYDFQTKTLNVNYWNWEDALFMAMPAMAKIYRRTHNPALVTKMKEYFNHFDSKMFDASEGLYYRDTTYLYPKYKSKSGKKDFWSRGNGWVFSAFARVMRELDSVDSEVYRERFCAMARAIRRLQTDEGYFYTSLLDPLHAKGCESSGTSLFLYGLCCGVNDGILDDKEYAPVIEKAWCFLSETAVQPDYTVGYVYDMREKEMTRYVANPRTSTNYGTGCFLLAASEYAKYLEKTQR